LHADKRPHNPFRRFGQPTHHAEQRGQGYHDTTEEVTASPIKKAEVLFTPGKKLQEMLNNFKYTKI
jgi:hypothetical protein